MDGAFAGLVGTRELREVAEGFTRIVDQSFDRTTAAGIVLLPETRTNAEVRRRTAICIKVFRELRGDLHWSVTRILDYLPRILRCELDGTPWTPDDRAAWMPGKTG